MLDGHASGSCEVVGIAVNDTITGVTRPRAVRYFVLSGALEGHTQADQKDQEKN